MDYKEKIEAIINRDSRYDDMFCYGVKTTGIVCKPSCPAKRPKIDNIELFDTPEQAMQKGYRLCKICMRHTNTIHLQHYQSPCGELLLGSYEDRLCLCDWTIEKHHGRVIRRLQKTLHADYKETTSDILNETVRQLDEYFAGKRRNFTIPLLFVGTDFQKKVWNKLLEIPYGKAVSYGELARMIDMRKAVRAVANANGANAISILAPCHRIIGSDRSLTGYGGGLAAKKLLLDLETTHHHNLFDE